MAITNIYLNFTNQTEAAFTFYQSIFGGEFEGGISRFGDVPAGEDMPPLSEEDKNLVMHMSLPLLGGVILMGCDMPEALGIEVSMGNNVHISLHPDTREETDRLFGALSEGGIVSMPLQDMFWGDYFGSCVDKFGVNWMLNFSKNR
ncbi:MAG: VOC family protein [Candidatus Paceibacteria bacterium]